jgi:hypothetical protein
MLLEKQPKYIWTLSKLKKCALTWLHVEHRKSIMKIYDHMLYQETDLDKIAHNDERALAVEDILNTFEPTSLPEISDVRLLKRMDTKYIFPEAILPGLLTDLAQDYYVLDVNGLRMQHYKTRYFDTPDFELYHQHHNGQRARYKLRVRSYLDTELDFLEVKRKDNHNWTQKSRMASEEMPTSQSQAVKSFLEDTFPVNRSVYVPKIVNSFCRIALVSKHDQERLSIDLDIRFLSPAAQFALPGVVVAEVKQPQFSIHSAFMQKMRQAGHRPISFSKYCVGVALAYPHLKRNKFKPLLLNLQNLILGEN